MRQIKLSATEMREYYTRTHRDALLHNPQDALDPITLNGGNKWVNRFCDYAHRLGMNKAFAYLETQWGSLLNRSVLDVGCGRGRWVKEYASRGAEVTGVDISPEAIGILAKEMPQHRFICQDLSGVVVPEAAFDVVNSVTVLQHLPEEMQRKVLPLIACSLRQGGYFVALENIVDDAAPHVFPHSLGGWIELIEKTGVRLCCSWGSNFEVLFRLLAPLARSFPRQPRGSIAFAPGTEFEDRHTFTHRARYAFKIPFALASFPLEWALHRMPLAKPTHAVMIFRKCAHLAPAFSGQRGSF